MHKKLLHIFFILAGIVFSSTIVHAQDLQDIIHQCAMSAGEDATYLKDFVVKLEKGEPNQRPPVFRQTLALRKNITYRFSLCTMDNSEGQPVLRLYDQARMVLSSYSPQTGKDYPIVNFQCKKSGIYTIMISFKEANAGEAIGILSYVK